MSVRQQYKLEEINNEIKQFQNLAESRSFDQAVEFFRQNLEKPTLFGLETSLIRAKLLKQIEVEELTNIHDRCFVLYSLALTLNLTGGYPNQAIPLYEKHNVLAEKINDQKSLSQSLGHHAKALRQVGRFYESEQIARKGLRIIRQRKDFLREAVNLYWLGMGLAHRGESIFSEIALQRSLRIFEENFHSQAESVVHTFSAQRAIWLGNYQAAISSANKAIEVAKKLTLDEEHQDLHGAVKILTAGLRIKGEALIFSGAYAESEELLQSALSFSRTIEFVEEELPALRALALKALNENNLESARDYLRQTWALSERGQFLLYNADSLNILSRLELADGQPDKAVETAQKAFKLSICDGIPYSYWRGLIDSQKMLHQLQIAIPKTPKCVRQSDFPLSKIEINPEDEFNL